MDKVYFQIDKRGSKRLYVLTFENGKRKRYATVVHNANADKLRMYRRLFYHAYDTCENVSKAVEMANEELYNIVMLHFVTQ